MPRAKEVFEATPCVICGELKEIRRFHSKKRYEEAKTCGKQSCTTRLAHLTSKYKCICSGCKDEFESVRSNAKYCSEDCRTYRYQNTCVVCDKVFNSKKADTQTCSHDCRWTLNRSKEVTVECIYCENEFKRPSYTIRKGNLFCTKQCCNAYFAIENYGTFNRYGDNWAQIRREVIEFYDYQCLSCNSKLDIHSIHVHHCIPFRFFDSKESANVFDNLIPLCEKCHYLSHSVENRQWYESNFLQRKDIVRTSMAT